MDDRQRIAAAPVALRRGQVAVCVVDDGDSRALEECLDLLRAHTPEHVPIIVCGGISSPGSGLPSADSVASAIAETNPADVVVLSARCAVDTGWLEGLRETAYRDSTVATASPLQSSGPGGVIVAAGRAVRHPAEIGFERAAEIVRGSSLRIRPHLTAPGSDCVYVRRSAIELAGGNDIPFGTFADRCLRSSLSHRLADSVLVQRLAGPGEDRLQLRGPGSSESVARTMGAVRRALNGLSVAIDARSLTGPMNGTAVQMLELIGALARSGDVGVTVIASVAMPGEMRALIEVLPGVAIASAAEETARIQADVIHRPSQISAPADLSLLAGAAERIVITHLDLISYHNPAYFSSRRAWQGYREMTGRALAAADRVVFMSPHVRDDALDAELVEADRASVVPLGVDHVVVRGGREAPEPPAGAEAIAEADGVMLCLGTDFWHKNRVFALQLLDQLQRRHEWPGVLVLAGPHVACGSSADAEQELLSRRNLAASVIRLGEVSEAEKAWLFEHASLVLYPSVHEGFGLVPFEAAEHGVPCLWAAGTSLSDVLPDAAAGIVAWDIAQSADRALTLMRDADAATANVQAIRSAAAQLTWDAAAKQLIEIYRSVCDAPAVAAAKLERADGLMRGGFSDDAVRLLGPEGAIPRELERPLLALAMRPKLAAPVFAVLKTAYRLTQRRARRG